MCEEEVEWTFQSFRDQSRQWWSDRAQDIRVSGELGSTCQEDRCVRLAKDEQADDLSDTSENRETPEDPSP